MLRAISLIIKAIRPLRKRVYLLGNVPDIKEDCPLCGTDAGILIDRSSQWCVTCGWSASRERSVG